MYTLHICIWMDKRLNANIKLINRLEKIKVYSGSMFYVQNYREIFIFLLYFLEISNKISSK